MQIEQGARLRHMAIRHRQTRKTKRRKGSAGRRFRLIELALFLWVFRLTTSGKYLAGACLLCVVTGSSTLELPIFNLFLGVAALFATAFLMGALARPRVTVSGGLPEKASAGQPVVCSVALRNASGRRIQDLSASLFGMPPALKATQPAAVIEALEPGQTGSVSFEVLPLRRGLHQLPRLRPYSTFPFGLLRTGAKPVQGKPLLVLPSFHPLADIHVPVNSRYQPGGIALTSNVGESPEYIGNREYRSGDPWRHIDFRSWARIGKPVVREFQEEYYFRIALVLDTYVPGRSRAPREGFRELEAAVSLSAAVADALAKGEYIIDIFAAGPELYVFRAGRHIAQFENVLEILACVDACRTNPFDVVTPAVGEELTSVSTVICVFLDWDATRRELVRTALESGCQVKVLIVRDGETTLPITDGATEDIAVYTPEAVRSGGLDVV
jgi:uncharacterized protein (DUF58 family)